MAAVESLSDADQEFIAQCKEELKDIFTEKDEAFMKVFNSEPSKPPIIDPWYVSHNSGRRNDRRNNRRHHTYEQYGNRDRHHHDRRDNYDRRGYDDYNTRQRHY